ncbi:MAG TPA: alpha-L-fucosidase [Bacteroidales bacterium]|nr:alpha-L-fucosidase [Bacteroidales bacterium]
MTQPFNHPATPIHPMRPVIPAILLTLSLVFFPGSTLFSQGNRPVYTGHNAASVPAGVPAKQVAEQAGNLTPSARQLAWQRTEFNAFIHFGLNTFTGKEWGDGKDDPALFNPVKLDARQWVRTFRDAGMKMVILTARHHDGFCLWPTTTTGYSVAASPWKNGKGDVVGEVAAACREYGLKFGVYLSPWDRHEPAYGSGETYNRYFMTQLRELLTGYGEISEVWFDGACGEGPNGKKQSYDWSAWYALVRELQPGAVIAIMGPDVRWVGTESGYGRETEWSVIPGRLRNPESLPEESDQSVTDREFLPGDLMDADLGSREKLSGARSLLWYPAETDVSIRPGWFHHSSDNKKVKSPQELADIYFHSAGMNSVLLLNVPPDKRGLIHKNDIRSLTGLRKILDATFTINLIEKATSRYRNGIIEYDFPAAVTFDVAMLQEDIKTGQRIGKFRFEAWDGTSWKPFTTGTTAGYKRLLRFPAVTAQKVRLVIEEARGEPALMNVGLYLGSGLPALNR